MARARATRSPRRSTKNKSHFLLSALPESVQAFIARRIVDVFAGFFFICGIISLVAFASYDHRDPSMNTAAETVTSIHNWAGLPGSYLADLFMQTIGFGSFAMSITFMFWGGRMFLRQSMRPFPLRILTMIIACIGSSLALAQWPAGDTLTHPYLGGTAGTILMNTLSHFGMSMHDMISPLVIASIAGIIALSALIYACAVTFSEMRMIGGWIKDRVISFLVLLWNISMAFYGWIRRYNDPSYQAPQIKIPTKPKAPRTKAPASAAAARIAEEPAIADPIDPPKPHADIPVMAAQQSTAHQTIQPRFSLDGVQSDWEFPPLDLIQSPPDTVIEARPDERALRQNAELLGNVLGDFNVEGDIVSIHPGPVVTLYELEPAPGVKSARVISLSDDIARSMSAISVRAAVVPGRNVIGIELPNKDRQIVYLKELLTTQDFAKTKAKLPLILGKDIGGQPVIADLAKMPHLLVAGTTGSGKSVGINTMILSLLYGLPPEKCRFIMIDPKMLELSVYNDIPHLLCPVVTEPGKAVVSLKWAVQEMEERYRAMSKLGVRNIEGYNARLKEARDKGEALMRKVQTGFDPGTGKPIYEEQPLDLTELPYIVIIVDEFADLMLVAGKDVESAIQRLAQMARAAGIHLIMATQRPSVDVITGVIKANFPTRISFQVTSKVDSRTILGEGGAEQLLGMGDMLYMAPGGQVKRVHGPFVSDDEVENVVEHLKLQGEPNYIESVTQESDFGDSEVMNAMFGDGDAGGGSNSVDELYDQAVALVAKEQKASTSFVQRYLQIGYNRAARIIEEMERQGVISKASPTGKRDVLVGDWSGEE